MNSDLMPSSESSESSNLSASSMEAQDNSLEPSSNADSKDNSQTVENPNSTVSESESEKADDTARQQPIPPPSEPMQYRAIGLVRGRYAPTSEQFTQGALVTPDNVELDAVLLGRIMSLVKNHLDLEKDHLWVVYPRTRQENDNLHLQIVGVWEPEKLAVNRQAKEDSDSSSPEADEESVSDDSSSPTSEEPAVELTPSSEIPDGGFSVRGEVVYQSFDAGNLVVKIKQAPRKADDKPKYFKLKLTGKLETKAVGKFWDFQVQREADLLVIEKAEFIADLPKKRRPPFKKGGGRPPRRGAGGRPGGGKPYSKRYGGDTPRPVKKAGQSDAPKPQSNRPTPKPIKRQKPPEG
ncbi:hypothetical protein Riv7116_1290 [Rivularia sp. PCC 7116]|uniref:hypothetical protein n=1 Tax=Rivularia sp. PCC 7116 TaxID=373994 RepID=UPI00029F1CC3|nr:hypothetical protein [Rivularia sp. PCC 7116]AFY53856.1 hypothetical protein Riv7116_1290 [Rivularia sp. PCC 7116]